MPHERSWGKFKVCILFNQSLDDQFRTASFDLQRLTLWILLTRPTSLAYHNWEWKIDHCMRKWTRHSLPSPRPPSTIVYWPGYQPIWGFRQSVVQDVEHKLSAIQDPSITSLWMDALMWLILLIWISVLPRQRFKPQRWTLSTACFTEGSIQLVRTQECQNHTMNSAALIGTSSITTLRCWLSSPRILFILSAALLLPLRLACNSQLVCLRVSLPLPAAASPSPAVIAIATATKSPTSPESWKWDLSTDAPW